MFKALYFSVRSLSKLYIFHNNYFCMLKPFLNKLPVGICQVNNLVDTICQKKTNYRISLYGIGVLKAQYKWHKNILYFVYKLNVSMLYKFRYKTRLLMTYSTLYNVNAKNSFSWEFKTEIEFMFNIFDMIDLYISDRFIILWR